MSVVRGPLSVAKGSLTTDNGQLTTDNSLLLLRGCFLLASGGRSSRGSAFGGFLAFGGLAADDFGLGRAFGFDGRGRNLFKHFLHGGHDQLAILHGLH